MTTERCPDCGREQPPNANPYNPYLAHGLGIPVQGHDRLPPEPTGEPEPPDPDDYAAWIARAQADDERRAFRRDDQPPGYYIGHDGREYQHAD